MSGSVAYLDSSAFVKLVVPEPESQALKRRLQAWPDRSSSMLLRTEAIRAVAEAGPSAIRTARAEMRRVRLVRLTVSVLDRAATIPGAVRSIDAIHVASALRLGVDLGVLITYDRWMADLADGLGLAVESPA